MWWLHCLAQLSWHKSCLCISYHERVNLRHLPRCRKGHSVKNRVSAICCSHVNHVGASLIPPGSIYIFNLLLFLEFSHKRSCFRRSAQMSLPQHSLTFPASTCLAILTAPSCSLLALQGETCSLQYEGKLLRRIVYFKWCFLAVI